MPCTDGRDHPSYRFDEERAQLRREIIWLEGALCAVLSNTTEVTDNLVRRAARNGKVKGLAKWWKNHQKQDAQRVLSEVKGILSEDELKVLVKHIKDEM